MQNSANSSPSPSAAMKYAVSNNLNDKKLLFENESNRSFGLCLVSELFQEIAHKFFNQAYSEYQQQCGKSI